MPILGCPIHGRQPCEFASSLYVANALADIPPPHLVALELRSSVGSSSFWVDDEFLVAHGLVAEEGKTVVVCGDDPVFEVYAKLEPFCLACDAEYRQKHGIARARSRSSESTNS